jgi:hypothetical protein
MRNHFCMMDCCNNSAYQCECDYEDKPQCWRESPAKRKASDRDDRGADSPSGQGRRGVSGRLGAGLPIH